MAQLHVLMGPDTIRARPTVRRIGLADLKDALARGFADFSAIPTHAVFLCLIYPIVGLVLARAIMGYALLPLLFPLAAGFALVGPFAAIGFYELSRRREQVSIFPGKTPSTCCTRRHATPLRRSAFCCS